MSGFWDSDMPFDNVSLTQNLEAFKDKSDFSSLYDETLDYDIGYQFQSTQFISSHGHDHGHEGLNDSLAAGSFPGPQHHAPPGTAEDPIQNPKSTAKVMVKPRSGGKSRFEKSKTAEKASMRADGLTAWGLLLPEASGSSGSHSQHQGVHGADDEDGQSTCSSCPDTCPSHCGEAGQGSICCDADDCDATAVCVDEACEAANNPCTDETCFSEPFVASGNREDAAAAATLTSFGDLGDMGDPSTTAYSLTFGGNAPANGLDHFQLGFEGMHGGSGGSFNNYDSAPANGHNNVQLGFGGMDGNSGGSSNNFDMSAINSDMGYNQYEAWFQPNNRLFLRHLATHHQLESQQAEREQPCHVQHSLWMGDRCPLPHTNMNIDQPNDLYTLANQGQNFQCSFEAPDPTAMTDHVLTQHGPFLDLLSNSEFTSQVMGSHYSNVPILDADFINGMEMQPSKDKTARKGIKRKREVPTSPEVTTNASLQTPSTLTSNSPSTPSSANLFRHGPLILEREDTPVTRPETKPPIQSIGPDNAFDCKWIDRITGKVCGKNCTDADDLDQHCKEVHTQPLNKETGYQCMWEVCKSNGPSFGTKAKLNRHIQVHTGYKPMQCHICQMRLSAKQALDQHLRTHTHERPFKCDYPGCSRSFKQHSALTMHHRTHTGEKPLKCNICGEVFGESSNLSKHRRIHNEKGAYECSLCGKDFHRQDQLRRHLESKHKDSPKTCGEIIAKHKNKSAKTATPNPEPNLTTDGAFFYPPSSLP